MTVLPVSRARIVAAVLLGCVAVLALAHAFPPGRYDVSPLATFGTTAVDEGYASSPLAGRDGPGSLDEYDHDRALALAFPQNLAGRAALAIGLPLDVARRAGSFVAAFAVVVLAVLYGGFAGAALAVVFLTPLGIGHLASDLPHAPAYALVAAWVWAVARGRPALAAFLAGVAVHQAGVGLFLAAGSLAAAFAEDRGRGGGVLRVAAFSAAGLAACAALAWMVFGDDPLSFFLRPYAVLSDLRPTPSLFGSVFADADGAGPALAIALLAALLCAPRSQPGAGLLVATVAGLALHVIFPDPPRLLPLVPLLVVPGLASDRAPSATKDGLLLALLLAPITASSVVKALGWAADGAPLVALAGGTVAIAFGSFAPPALPRWLAGAALVATAVLGPREVSRDPRLFAHDLHDLAATVARHLGPRADLVGYAVISLRLDGRLWHVDSLRHWQDELAWKAPPRIWRLRTAPLGVEPPPPPPQGPAGYQAIGDPERLGPWRYDRDDGVVEVLLDELRPPPRK